VEHFRRNRKKRKKAGATNRPGALIGRDTGCFGVHGNPLMAHRFAYELQYGKIPEGKQVFHKCEVPWRVSPRHLKVG
jgi:hypothetical protein